jgi:hypothetical protein
VHRSGPILPTLAATDSTNEVATMTSTTSRPTLQVTRLLVVLLSVLALAFTVPGVAGADQPQDWTDVIVHEDAVSPCGTLHTVTIVFSFRSHEHNNNAVSVADAELTTDDGFIGKGHQTDVFVHGVRRTTTNHMLHHPETGERFSVKVRFWMDMNTGEFIKGSPVPTFRCIQAPN